MRGFEKAKAFQKTESKIDCHDFANAKSRNDEGAESGKQGQRDLDSEAEIEWANILKKLAKECAKSIEINGDRIYLFGKNFIEKSNVKYEYYDTRKRVSYPDFIFKDKGDRVHIFEVKSVNKSRGQMIESDEYREKIERLKVAYIEASKKIGARLQRGGF